jgi:hypothetical protein
MSNDIVEFVPHSTKAQAVTIGNVTYPSKAAAARGLIKMGHGKTPFSTIAKKLGVGITLVSTEYKKMYRRGEVSFLYESRRGLRMDMNKPTSRG